MEVIAAFVQLYRENARYLHRIYKWVAKVGPRLVPRADRRPGDPPRACYDRFMLSASRSIRPIPGPNMPSRAERAAWPPWPT